MLILAVVLATFFMIVYKSTNGFTKSINDVDNSTIYANGTGNATLVNGTVGVGADTGFQLPTNATSTNTGNKATTNNDLILNYFSNIGTSTGINANTNTNTNTNTNSTAYMLPPNNTNIRHRHQLTKSIN